MCWRTGELMHSYPVITSSNLLADGTTLGFALDIDSGSLKVSNLNAFGVFMATGGQLALLLNG